MAVPIGGFPGGVVLGGFTCHRASFRVAGVAPRDMWTCLVTCRKLFCMAGAILLRWFQNMRCIFRGRRGSLDVSIFVVAGAALQTCRLACFFANRIGRAAGIGDKLQIAWQAQRFVRCDEIWRKLRAKHRF